MDGTRAQALGAPKLRFRQTSPSRGSGVFAFCHHGQQRRRQRRGEDQPGDAKVGAERQLRQMFRFGDMSTALFRITGTFALPSNP